MSPVQKVYFSSNNNDFKWLMSNNNITPEPLPDKKDRTLKTAVYVSSAASLAAIGIAAVALSRGMGKPLQASFNQRLNTFSDKIDDLAKADMNISDTFNTAVNAIKDDVSKLGKKVNDAITNAGEALKNSQKNQSLIDEKSEWYDKWLNSLTDRQNSIAAARSSADYISRCVEVVDGIPLLRNLSNDGKPKELPTEVKTYLKNVASDFINGNKSVAKKMLNKNATIWSVTAESIPEKSGGLGEVPVQMAKNMTKLGIDNYVVRPMSLIPGVSKLVFENNKYTYLYNINEPSKLFSMPVDLVASFKTEVFRDGHPKLLNVDVFTGWDPRQGHKRLMFKCDDYFTSSGLYDNSYVVSENERYALLPKLAYEFNKLLVDPNSMTEYKLFDKITDIKAPSAMILNDWHAAALAALMRLKAPVEAAFGTLNNSAAEMFKTMNLVNINHNLEHQGIDWAHKGDILNSLFGEYAYDIYKYAKTGFGKGIANALTIDGNVNLANMAACYSTIMRPVSPNYAYEISHDISRGLGMTHILNQRYNNGTLKGRSNGWDRSVNEISLNSINGFNTALNGDKFSIFKDTLTHIQGLSDDEKIQMNKILSEKIDSKEFKVKIEKLKAIGSKAINNTLDDLKRKGIFTLRKFTPNTHEDSMEHIILARKKNKAALIDYMNSMVEYKKTKNRDLFNILNIDTTSVKDVKPEDLDDTIVFNMGARFVKQKGIDIAADVMNNVLTDWETKYPGKKKPVFIVGGKDEEGDRIKKYIIALKEKMGNKGEHIIHMDGYVPNNILQGGSDFTLYPSYFEPDGAKWESLYKGTPVICTRVGGHVDSVKDGVNGFLTERTVDKIKKSLNLPDFMNEEETEIFRKAMSDDFTKAVYRAVDSYYSGNNHTQMIRNAIDGDQSWVIKDSDGNIVGGTLREYLDDLGFDIKDFTKEIPKD